MFVFSYVVLALTIHSSLNGPWSSAASHTPMHFYKSVYMEVISAL